MLYGNYFIGQNRHRLLLTGGITNFLAVYRNQYPSETVSGAEAGLGWNTGLGYHYEGRVTFLRVTGYFMALPEPSEFLPQYFPWVGLSTGVRF